MSGFQPSDFVLSRTEKIPRSRGQAQELGAGAGEVRGRGDIVVPRAGQGVKSPSASPLR